MKYVDFDLYFLDSCTKSLIYSVLGKQKLQETKAD